MRKEKEFWRKRKNRVVDQMKLVATKIDMSKKAKKVTWNLVHAIQGQVRAYEACESPSSGWWSVIEYLMGFVSFIYKLGIAGILFLLFS